jgi:putative tryptophan/tyrosine transport system substrate-binding protein
MPARLLSEVLPTFGAPARRTVHDPNRNSTRPKRISSTGLTPVVKFGASWSRGPAEQNAPRVAAYRKGLSEAGFIEGQNVAIEFRWADWHEDRLPDTAADLVRRQVAVIAAPNAAAVFAAKAATTTIPIVFATGADPVALGFVASLNRPGGNVTGITSLNNEVTTKRLGVLRELVPQAARYFTLVNPTSVLAQPFIKDLQTGAATLGIHVDILRARTEREIDAAFASLPQQPGNVLVFGPEPFFYDRREQIAALAVRYTVPAAFDVRDYVDAGGLMSYGGDFLNVMQLAGVYTGRILEGAKPADLPVQQTTKFEFVINLKTAKALGVAVPPTLLALTDDVIE